MGVIEIGMSGERIFRHSCCAHMLRSRSINSESATRIKTFLFFQAFSLSFSQ